MDFRSHRETGRCASGYGGAICMYAAGNRHEQTKPGGTDRAGATWPVPYRGERRNVRIRCRRRGVGTLWGHSGLGFAGRVETGAHLSISRGVVSRG